MSDELKTLSIDGTSKNVLQYVAGDGITITTDSQDSNVRIIASDVSLDDYEEIDITMTDTDGNTVTKTVLAKKVVPPTPVPVPIISGCTLNTGGDTHDWSSAGNPRCGVTNQEMIDFIFGVQVGDTLDITVYNYSGQNPEQLTLPVGSEPFDSDTIGAIAYTDSTLGNENKHVYINLPDIQSEYTSYEFYTGITGQDVGTARYNANNGPELPIDLTWIPQA